MNSVWAMILGFVVVSCGRDVSESRVKIQEETINQDRNLPDSKDANIVPARKEKKLNNIKFKE